MHRVRPHVTSADVIIIGAGMTGLTLARELQERGINCRVVEARNRVGGRISSERLRNGAVFNHGAGWLHWQEHGAHGNDLMHKVLRHGIAHDVSDRPDRLLVHLHGRIWDSSIRRHLSETIDHTVMSAVEQGLEDEPLRSLFAERSAEAALVRYFANNWYAAKSPERLKVRHMLQDDRFSSGGIQLINGMSELPEALAEDVGCWNIDLETPITEIDHHGNRAVLKTADGDQYHARMVVCTVPVGVLKHHGIAFTQGLNPETQKAIFGRYMGSMEKLCIPLDPSYFHQEHELQDRRINLLEGEDTALAVTGNIQKPHLTLLTGGSMAKRVNSARKDTRIELAEELLSHSPRLRQALRHVRDEQRPLATHWQSDPLSYGSYSTTPDVAPSGPVKDGCVIFAGESFNEEHFGYMNSAACSAMHAADMVCHTLATEDRSHRGKLAARQAAKHAASIGV